MTKKSYQKYLSSEHWQQFRKLCYKLAGYTCSRCGANNRQLHAHHLSYSNLYHEEYGKDVIVVCDRCHGLIHASDTICKSQGCDQPVYSIKFNLCYNHHLAKWRSLLPNMSFAEFMQRKKLDWDR